MDWFAWFHHWSVFTSTFRLILLLTMFDLTGLTAFLVIRMWFGKAVEDFNKSILKGGSGAPQLVANTSNGFVSTCYPTTSHLDTPL